MDNKTPDVFDKDMIKWANNIDKMFLESTKGMLITSPWIILFYITRLFMLSIFWYGAIFVFTNHAFLALMFKPKFYLPYMAVYMAVSFNAFFQTFDFIQQMFKEVDRYKHYKKTEKEYLARKALVQNDKH